MCKDMPPLEAAIQFHGHICPGLLMGVRAAEFARQYLDIDRDTDEELLAIVETDSCGVDAIQAILGCTLGKGNLIVKDYGKAVYTISSRSKARAMRSAHKFGATDSPAKSRCRELKSRSSVSDAQQLELENLFQDICEMIMTRPFEELYQWQEVPFEMPPTAELHPTVQCAACQEGVMATRLIESGLGKVCRPCYEKMGGGN